jgi:hypothetical protein
MIKLNIYNINISAPNIAFIIFISLFFYGDEYFPVKRNCLLSELKVLKYKPENMNKKRIQTSQPHKSPVAAYKNLIHAKILTRESYTSRKSKVSDSKWYWKLPS